MAKLTLKSIQSAIGSFTSNREKLQVQAHSIAMMIFNHAAPLGVGPDCNGTGDCSEAVNLLKAMPKSWATQMLDWFKANSPIRVNISTGKYGYAPEYHKLDTPELKLAAWKLEQANSVPFYDFTKEESIRDNSFDSEDFLKGIGNQIKRATKALDDGNVKDSQITAVKALIKMYETISTQAKAIVVPANTDTANAKAA